MMGEAMQPMRFHQLSLLALFAALVVAASAHAESAAAAAAAAKATDVKGKGDDHAPAFYVKEGDTYRRATDAEVKAAGGGAEAHGEGGLAFTGIKRYDLGIYTLLVFLILVVILWKFAWPHISEGLQKREDNIRSALDQAKQGQVEATALLAQAKRELDETAAKVKGMLDEARRDADALRADQREAGVKDAQTERERAKREIEAAKDVALKDIYEQSVRLAALMSEKALRRKVSPEDHRRLLDEALADLKSGGKA
jgi:F-type H+-transporting ATPase subunit b